MPGKRIGYIRVSSVSQNVARQQEQLDLLSLDRIFEDKCSGKSLDRPALTQLMAYIRDSDEIFTLSLDRLGRNCNELQFLVKTITDAGASIHFIKEGLTFTGDDSSVSRLLLNVMSAFSQFERELIKERQQQGIEIAKANGVYKGRTKSLKSEQITELKEKVATGIPKAKIAREMGISRKSLYNYLQKG
jgi:DNA invertase Pin-like site-specific DNA recombinase